MGVWKTKERVYNSSEHANNFNTRHAKILSNFSETRDFVNNCFNKVHAKRVSISEEGSGTCSRVNETQILCQLNIDEGSSGGHKGWAEFDQTHLSVAGRFEASRVEVSADPSLEEAGRPVECTARALNGGVGHARAGNKQGKGVKRATAGSLGMMLLPQSAFSAGGAVPEGAKTRSWCTTVGGEARLVYVDRVVGGDVVRSRT